MSQPENPGVHARSEEVIDETAAAVRARLDRSTGDATYFRTGVLLDDVAAPGVAPQKVTAALRTIADREGGHGGVVVERTNPDANKLRWVGRVANGGESA